jgi:DNA-binding MarR family transcriptional regulator
MSRPKRNAGPPAPLVLETFLPYRLAVVAELASRGLSRIYAERYGIDIPQWRVIATLGAGQSMTATALGRHSQMHKTKVSRAVAALERRQLLQRSPVARDRREADLSLSADGARLYRDLVGPARRYARELERSLDRDEARMLDAILAKLSRRAAELAAQSSAPDRGAADTTEALA